MIANPNCLRCVYVEVQYPTAECGTEDKSAKFVSRGHRMNAEMESTNNTVMYMLSFYMCLEAELKKRHPHRAIYHYRIYD